MTTTAPAPARHDAATTETTIRRRQVPWRSWRKPLAIFGVLVISALALAWLTPEPTRTELDPRSPEQQGGRALAEVLREQGVEVTLVETTDDAVESAGRGTTLLVANGDYLSTPQARRLAELPGDIVLLEPPPRVLSVLAPGVKQVGFLTATRRQEALPRCDVPAAQRAGAIDAGGAFYDIEADAEAVGCYVQTADSVGEDASGPTFVRLPRPNGGTLTIVGKSGLITNERLGERGNAALVLGTLGGQERLVWYLPSREDVPAEGERTALELLPRGVGYGALMATLAALVFALWRARRLGPVVVEPLPVVVRAAETAEGRSRLYRRARAYDSAANALRSATLRRLRTALGLGRGAAAEEIVDAVASRTGRPPQQVAYLLYGPPPDHDAALVGLADELDQLDREVRDS